VLIDIATFSDSTVGHKYLCTWEWQKFVSKLLCPKSSGPRWV